jgi:hypothetical protein
MWYNNTVLRRYYMTVSELIAKLSEIAGSQGGDMKVIIGNEGWPVDIVSVREEVLYENRDGELDTCCVGESFESTAYQHVISITPGQVSAELDF